MRWVGMAAQRTIAVITAFLAVALVLAAPAVSAQIQPPTKLEIQGSTSITVFPNGNARVVEEMKMSTEAFTRFKKVYDPLSTLIRDLKPRSSPTQITNIKVNVDEASNTINITYDQLGAAQYLGNGKWFLPIEAPREGKVTLSSINGNTIVLTKVYALGYAYDIIETVTVKLPQDATNPRYDEDSGGIVYEMPLPGDGQHNTLIPRAAGAALILAGAVAAAWPILASRRSERVAAPPNELGAKW